jgi:hypothetical protein
MTKPMINHILLDTSCSNEFLDQVPSYAWIAPTPEYVVGILKYMDLVTRLHRKDQSLYCLERWDSEAQYLSYTEELETIQDVRSRMVTEIPRGEPILLSDEPELPDAALVRVECATIQISPIEVWWTAYIKHTDDRAQTMHLAKRVLRDIQYRFR